MPLSKKTKKRIYDTIWHLTRYKDLTEFKFGLTRMGISKRFYSHKKGEGYEHIVALADNLNLNDAVELEEEIHTWAAGLEARKYPSDKHVYKKFAQKNMKYKYSQGPGENPKSPCHSVYIVWCER
jgi:hypothetical protein